MVAPGPMRVLLPPAAGAALILRPPIFPIPPAIPSRFKSVQAVLVEAPVRMEVLGPIHLSRMIQTRPITFLRKVALEQSAARVAPPGAGRSQAGLGQPRPPAALHHPAIIVPGRAEAEAEALVLRGPPDKPAEWATLVVAEVEAEVGTAAERMVPHPPLVTAATAAMVQLVLAMAMGAPPALLVQMEQSAAAVVVLVVITLELERPTEERAAEV